MIAGDDAIGMGGDRASQDVIVVWVADDAWRFDGFDEFDGFDVIGNDWVRRSADCGELFGGGRSCEHVGKFFKQHGATVEPDVLMLAYGLQ